MKKILLFVFIAAAVVIAIFAAADIFQPGQNAPSSEALLHYSVYSQKDFFEQAFAAAPSSAAPEPNRRIRGILFNHHLLAPHFIAQTFAAGQNQQPRTLVILAPNHFMVGSGQILTSRLAWQTPYGQLQPDLETIQALTDTGLVKVDEQPFENEMGIANVVAFAKRVFPNVRLVPLIVKDNTSDAVADKLARSLQKILPADNLIAGSFDFSHYQTLEIANQHDENSLIALGSLNFQDVRGLDVDSRPGLRVLLEFLSLAKADSFTLLRHSNSALVTKNLTATSTTSYITGYFSSR